jgi:hypothetical protein
MLALEKDCVVINREADEVGVWGILNIKRGLKRQARTRKVCIDHEMKGDTREPYAPLAMSLRDD